ncbi:hypothetical protein EV385_3120 [Krasilnikovia cinnamomea]|uniref:Uncharacterized protein n=1 Tax=Krasilnikovia cinnamomea TaxID=349313 RepID=A0A4V2G763_9ACTN|nr:hypothetical protein EV385_3120 [Krasilnikovia cinnamomea]
MAFDQIMLMTLAVLCSAVLVYGLWQMARGWRARRPGESNVLIADGAARFLSGVHGWVMIAMLTGVARRLGGAGTLSALILALTLLALAAFIRRRWGSAAPRRTATGGRTGMER